MRTIKKIFKFISTIVLCYLIYFIWANQDTIISIGYNIMNSNRKIIIPDTVINKRYYNFDSFILNEQYKPSNKLDLINITYNYLNNGWNEFTFYCPDEYESCMDDLTEINKNRTLLSAVNNYVSPYNSFSNFYAKLGSDGSVSYTKLLKYNPENAKRIDERIDKLIEKYDDKDLPIKDRIKIFHDYLIKKVDYDTSEDAADTSSASAYGALFNGKAICEGYADAMALFLDKLEVPNFKVASKNHIWNVALVNGKWLHIDVTWDDPINSNTSVIDHTYFLVTTKKLLELDTEEHTIDYSLREEYNLFRELK